MTYPYYGALEIVGAITIITIISFRASLRARTLLDYPGTYHLSTGGKLARISSR